MCFWRGMVAALGLRDINRAYVGAQNILVRDIYRKRTKDRLSTLPHSHRVMLCKEISSCVFVLLLFYAVRFLV
jgi:hypothetical protein